MHISDLHVDAVRTFLDDPEAHERLVPRLTTANDLLGYRAMVAATMVELANARLGPTDRAGQITRWVANARARLIRDEVDLVLDPAAAEGLLRTVSGLQNDYLEVSEQLRGETQYLVLALLHQELALDREALDELLGRARSAAESLED